MKVLKSQKVLQLAASISREFKMDPVEVLNANSFLWQVRVAAYEVVREQKKKEADQAKTAARSGRKR